MKRKAEHHLDRDSFLREDDDDNNNQRQPNNNNNNNNNNANSSIATPEQIAQRRIVKLKMPSQIMNNQGEQPERAAPKFELAGSLTSNNNNNTNASASDNQANQTSGQQPSFLSTIVNSSNTSQQSATGQSQSGGLFSSILSKPAENQQAAAPAQEQKPNLFASIISKTTENPQTGTTTQEIKSTSSLFSSNKPGSNPLFPQGSGGLFAAAATKSSADSAPSSNNLFSSGNIFSSVFGGGSGLASLANKDYSYVHNQTGEDKDKEKEQGAETEKDKEQAKSTENKPSLFASLSGYTPPANSSLGLFGSTNKTPSLFGNLAGGTPSTFSSLFQGTSTGSNLFGGASAGGSGLFGASSGSGLFGAQAAGGGDGSGDEDDGGDDEPARTPSPEADVTKSKGNYQYQQDYDKLISKKVNKFKPGNKNMLVEGEISLNRNKTTNAYFLIYRNKAKLIQYQGQLYPELSKIEYLNPRQDAMSIVAVSSEKAEPAKEGEETPLRPKMSRDTLKAMFGTSDDCNEFKKELERVLG